MSSTPLVLIVDDTPGNVSVLTGLLKNSYRIGFATTGQKAIEYANTYIPDIILLDIMMPEMDGYETCARLKENKLTSHIPIIFISVMNKPEDTARGFGAGAADFITKPFDREEVMARVKTHLELKNYRDTLEDLVQQRTTELTAAKTELEETNTALKVLLRTRDEEQKKLEENILYNVEKLIKPWITKFKNTDSVQKKNRYFEFIDSAISEIISPFSKKLSASFLNFTPSELQVANLIRQSKSTKEIAEILNLSTHTIHTHRKHIREKMGISNKKASLKIHLDALDGK